MAQKRITTWFLTIHKDDKDKDEKPLIDVKHLEAYIKDICKSNTEAYFILHDKDGEEDADGFPHIHLILKFQYNQGKTFNRMKTLFPQSHIEECFNFDSTVLYLTHETSTAKNEGKYQYPREEVVNVFETDIFHYYNKPVYEAFDFDLIEEYINDRGLTTILDYGRTFGFNVIASKWPTIKQIIEALHKERIRMYNTINNDDNSEENEEDDNDE